MAFSAGIDRLPRTLSASRRLATVRVWIPIAIQFNVSRDSLHFTPYIAPCAYTGEEFRAFGYASHTSSSTAASLAVAPVGDDRVAAAPDRIAVAVDKVVVVVVGE